jgi:hypothetical protein
MTVGKEGWRQTRNILRMYWNALPSFLPICPCMCIQNTYQNMYVCVYVYPKSPPLALGLTGSTHNMFTFYYTYTAAHSEIKASLQKLKIQVYGLVLPTLDNILAHLINKIQPPTSYVILSFLWYGHFSRRNLMIAFSQQGYSVLKYSILYLAIE